MSWGSSSMEVCPAALGLRGMKPISQVGALACFSPRFAGGRADDPGLLDHSGTCIVAGREDRMGFPLDQFRQN